MKQLKVMLFPWGDRMLVHPRVTLGSMLSWLSEVYLSQADVKDCYLIGGKLPNSLFSGAANDLKQELKYARANELKPGINRIQTMGPS